MSLAGHDEYFLLRIEMHRQLLEYTSLQEKVALATSLFTFILFQFFGLAGFDNNHNELQNCKFFPYNDYKKSNRNLEGLSD